MHWAFWRGKQQQQERQDQPLNGEKDLGFLGPELHHYYELVTPDVPLALTPKDLQHQVEEEKRLYLAANDYHPAYETNNHRLDSRGKPIISAGGVVRMNCREHRERYEQSMKSGFDIATRLRYRRQLDNCFTIQTEALDMLGYSRAITESRQNEIAIRVKQLYDDHLTQDGVLTKAQAEDLQLCYENEKIGANKRLWST